MAREKSRFYALLRLIDFSPCDNNKKKESWIEEVECDAMGGENVVSISQCYVYVCMSIDELKRT